MINTFVKFFKSLKATIIAHYFQSFTLVLTLCYTCFELGALFCVSLVHQTSKFNKINLAICPIEP